MDEKFMKHANDMENGLDAKVLPLESEIREMKVGLTERVSELESRMDSMMSCLKEIRDKLDANNAQQSG